MAVFDRKEDYLAVRWAQSVKQRDFYTCQICGCQGEYMESHHLNAWASFPDERYDLDNGICLCSSRAGEGTGCHDIFHSIYGKGSNTKEQFEEFEKIYGVMIKTANKDGAYDAHYNKLIKDIETQDIVEDIMKDLEDEQDSGISEDA